MVQLIEIEGFTTDRDNSKQDLPVASQTLLADFADIFGSPTGLPPIRNQDHLIPLET